MPNITEVVKRLQLAVNQIKDKSKKIIEFPTTDDNNLGDLFVPVYNDYMKRTEKISFHTLANEKKYKGLFTSLEILKTQAGKYGDFAILKTNTKKGLYVYSTEWEEIKNIPIDNLTSTDIDKPLSANQGKILKDYIDAINQLLTSDDTNLDELQEIVNYIKLNKTNIDEVLNAIPNYQAGEHITIDKTDPKNPIINAIQPVNQVLNKKLVLDTLNDTNKNGVLVKAQQGQLIIIENINILQECNETQHTGLTFFVKISYGNIDDASMIPKLISKIYTDKGVHFNAFKNASPSYMSNYNQFHVHKNLKHDFNGSVNYQINSNETINTKITFDIDYRIITIDVPKPKTNFNITPAPGIGEVAWQYGNLMFEPNYANTTSIQGEKPKFTVTSNYPNDLFVGELQEQIEIGAYDYPEFILANNWEEIITQHNNAPIILTFTTTDERIVESDRIKIVETPTPPIKANFIVESTNVTWTPVKGKGYKTTLKIKLDRDLGLNTIPISVHSFNGLIANDGTTNTGNITDVEEDVKINLPANGTEEFTEIDIYVFYKSTYDQGLVIYDGDFNGLMNIEIYHNITEQKVKSKNISITPPTLKTAPVKIQADDQWNSSNLQKSFRVVFANAGDFIFKKNNTYIDFDLSFNHPTAVIQQNNNTTPTTIRFHEMYEDSVSSIPNQYVIAKLVPNWQDIIGNDDIIVTATTTDKRIEPKTITFNLGRPS